MKKIGLLCSLVMVLMPISSLSPPFGPGNRGLIGQGYPYNDCPASIPYTANCRDADNNFKLSVVDAIGRYVNEDIAWCNTFAGFTLDVLDELWQHSIWEEDGDAYLGFYSGVDDRIGINDETNLQWRAAVAVHEGFHRWIGDDPYEGEEEDAKWWGKYCTGLLGGSS